MKYSVEIMHHFETPHNSGDLEAPTHTAEADNVACMDHLRLSMCIENGIVVDCAFRATGCVPVMALGSWVSEYARTKTLEQLKDLTLDEIERLVGGLPRSKKHAAYLVFEVLQSL